MSEWVWGLLSGYGLARFIDVAMQRPHMCDLIQNLCGQ